MKRVLRRFAGLLQVLADGMLLGRVRARFGPELDQLSDDELFQALTDGIDRALGVSRLQLRAPGPGLGESLANLEHEAGLDP